MAVTTATLEPGIHSVTMDHGKVNAMDLEFCEELERLLAELEENMGVDVVVLQGNSRAFSAGVDLKRLIAEPLDYVDRFLPALRQLFWRAVTFKKPLITAITGHALAGGCVLASAGDYRLLARDARIGMPELRVGLALPAEGLETFRFAVAPRDFQKVVTGGAWFANESAVATGLADALADSDLLDEAISAARNFQRIPRRVFELTKAQIRRPLWQRIRESHAEFGDHVATCWRDPTVRDNVAKYVRERLERAN